jgi:hypothetical protein
MAITGKSGSSDKVQAIPARSAQLRQALICFLLGLLGALPLVVLTPPFQVPDESQHFLRAYQLSERRIRPIVQDGETKAMLPSSLIELIESFLGQGRSLPPGRLRRNPCSRPGWRWIGLSNRGGGSS